MSGAELIIGVVAFVGQCYSGAIQAYLALQRCIDFPETASKLVLQLEVERIRLQLWGRNSGVEDGGLDASLQAYASIIAGVLEKVKNLIGDSDKLTSDYGLADLLHPGPTAKALEGHAPPQEATSVRVLAVTESDATSRAQGGPIHKVKAIFNDVFNDNFAVNGKQKRRRPLNQRASTLPSHLPTAAATLANTPFTRVRWAVASQSHFEGLILEIRTFVDSLNDLLRESQQASLAQDWRLLEVQAVADVEDPQALRAIEAATEGVRSCHSMHSMAHSKSIILSKHGQTVSGGTPDTSVRVLSKDDFDLPKEWQKMTRALAIYNPSEKTLEDVERNSVILVEKKKYDANISAEDKGLLLFRLYRLLELMGPYQGTHRGSLSSVGYWSEPNNDCWCVVYRVLTLPPPRSPAVPNLQLVSLLHWLSLSSFRPSLESRINLAYQLADTFCELYGSKWLHKSVRSENIVFLVPSGEACDISVPIVTGFEYSRQYTEQGSIDNTPFNLAHAVYRHPKYQGLAAKGYRMAYDIYSFGLVLAEIAWWAPLTKRFLAPPPQRGTAKANPSRISHSTSEPLSSTPASPSQITFGMQEANALRKTVLKAVQKELAFRVGSEYQIVVEWCLNCGDLLGLSDAELAVEFYEQVLVPLQSLARAWNR